MAELYINLSSTAIRWLCVEPPMPGGFESWIEDGAYVPSFSPNGIHKIHEFNLQNISSHEISSYLTFDFDRFAMASAESYLVANAEWKEKKLMSWPLIKLYYSAFFAAHAIMRSQGSGIIRIKNPQVMKIFEFTKLLDGKYPMVSSGTYLVPV